MKTKEMVAQQKDQELLHCRRLIEEKVGWGRGENWSNQDFEQLAEQIAEQSGTNLSSTTLKRVWGRVKYDSAPTTTTLNALAFFTGFENWRAFQKSLQNHQPEEQAKEEPLLVSHLRSEEAPSPPPVQPSRTLSLGSHLWLVTATLLAGAVGVAAFIQTEPKPLPASAFSFSSRPVSKGIPNSVVFEYDATASPTDSVFIQQSWDPSRRQLVPRNGNRHTSIYYYPGYFRAKLVVGQQIVQEHDLLIPSGGWHVAVRQEPVPVYFDSAETIRGGALHLPLTALKEQNIPTQPQPPAVQYRNVRDFKGLMNDNFVLETRLRNDLRHGSAACQYANLMLLCRNEMLMIPLTAKGCIGNLRVFLAGHQAESTTADLSGFGADMSEWVDVRMEVQDRHARILVNGQLVYEADIPNPPAEIVGISYLFEGTGSVDFVRFARLGGEVVYEDDFGGPAEEKPLP